MMNTIVASSHSVTSDSSETAEEEPGHRRRRPHRLATWIGARGARRRGRPRCWPWVSRPSRPPRRTSARARWSRRPGTSWRCPDRKSYVYGDPGGDVLVMIVSILPAAVFCASTPIAVWNSANAASNSGERVLRRVPRALRPERRVEEDVRRSAVAVVDDAEFGRAGARRIRGLAPGTTGRRRTCRAPRRPASGSMPASAAWLWMSTARSGTSWSSAAWSVAVQAGRAGVGQQLLGLLDVARPLRRRTGRSTW